MNRPPFKLAASNVVAGHPPPACCDADDPTDPTDGEAPNPMRMRLAQLDPHLHCSVIGTCLGTAELRKLMARFIDVHGASDLDVHHDAVRLAGEGGAASKALQKALDQRHDAALRRFGRSREAEVLATLWQDALQQGDVPGAYWAVLTHRHVTPALRQRVFGDVHMLSHLVGAANRADIRRLVALERDNAELRERLDRQQQRAQVTFDEHAQLVATLRGERDDARRQRADAPALPASRPLLPSANEAAAALIALQTERREQAEQALAVTAADAARLRDELAHLSRHAQALGRELAAAESQLGERSGEPAAAAPGLDRSLRGQRILYVGGRPSSAPTIRELVLRHGGEFQRHDGGLEDRKGLLAAGVAWAQLVVFPVDCVDHDSAANLKRLCGRHGVTYLPLRSAGVASFAAALSQRTSDAGDGAAPPPPICLRHG